MTEHTSWFDKATSEIQRSHDLLELERVVKVLNSRIKHGDIAFETDDNEALQNYNEVLKLLKQIESVNVEDRERIVGHIIKRLPEIKQRIHEIKLRIHKPISTYEYLFLKSREKLDPNFQKVLFNNLWGLYEED